MRIFLLLLLSFFLFAGSVSAIEDPSIVPNNKFGIHIIDENDLDRADELVNSTGGDWGYVTIVIRGDERNLARWQEVFNKMRRRHLIPIVRIASTQTNSGWKKPDSAEIDGWVSFLNSLNWVVKNRYVIIGNEPNQAHEWEGELAPEEYGKYLLEFSQKLKNTSPEFFVLPAGFDAAAPNSKTTMAEADYIKEMLKKVPESFDHIDGWTSHSYANVEKPLVEQFGIATARTYIWELDLLKSLGVKRNLPVFITETGWKHEGNDSEPLLGDTYQYLFEKVWKDDRIVAITPFLLKYNADPFLQFSWIKGDGKPYDFYHKVKDLAKESGNPNQITDGVIAGDIYFPIVQAGHGVYGILTVKNTGQSIWEPGEYGIRGGTLLSQTSIEPNQTKVLFFRVQAPDEAGNRRHTIQLERNGGVFGNQSEMFVTVLKIRFPFQFLPAQW